MTRPPDEACVSRRSCGLTRAGPAVTIRPAAADGESSVKTLLPGIGLALITALPALAADCRGLVIDVRPIMQYDHARGEGFLAVRAGPGAGFDQTGELYRSDEVAVLAREGGWLLVSCMAGQCAEPLWGPAAPQGWVYGRYLRLGGNCP